MSSLGLLMNAVGVIVTVICSFATVQLLLSWPKRRMNQVFSAVTFLFIIGGLALVMFSGTVDTGQAHKILSTELQISEEELSSSSAKARNEIMQLITTCLMELNVKMEENAPLANGSADTAAHFQAFRKRSENLKWAARKLDFF